jgi:HlyD family secretion protein
VIEQNVTTFPVLVRIPNRERLLKPGMNAEVEIRIGEEREALAVPNPALRDPADIEATALYLGLPPDSLKREMQAIDRRDLIVFALRNGEIKVVPVRPGLTDFDYTVVREGLALGDSVLILPTAGLLADQARRQEWIQRRVGGGPLGGN